jgi:thiamine kinase-like enzyme
LTRAIRNAPHLGDTLREKALSYLAALPDDKKICHGDFHPGNVLITDKGAIVIDWMTASSGNP